VLLVRLFCTKENTLLLIMKAIDGDLIQELNYLPGQFAENGRNYSCSSVELNENKFNATESISSGGMMTNDDGEKIDEGWSTDVVMERRYSVHIGTNLDTAKSSHQGSLVDLPYN
jgi:hypothetical protein